MEQPSLIEASAKNFMFNTLNQCHTNRINVYYYVFNISIFLIFVVVTCAILYRCSLNKPTEYEKQQKMLHDQQYVLSKIRHYQHAAGNAEDQHISRVTNLPFVQG